MSNHENNDSYNPFLRPTLLILILCAITVAIVYNVKENVLHADWQAKWTEVNNLLVPRRALAAVSAGNYIYAIGGVDNSGNYVAEVEFTEVLKNGLLGNWKKTSALNTGRFYLAAAVVNNYVYAIGGGTGPLGDNNQPTAIVEKAKILADGNLGPWQYENELTTPRRGLKVVVKNNTIYSLGGYNGQFLKTIEHVKNNNSGNLASWVLEPENARLDRYIHSAAIHQDYIYLIGGHVRGKNKLSYSDVEKSKIQHNSFLTTWEIEKLKLRQPRFIASAIAFNNYMYLLAGHDGISRLNSVEFSPINNSGELGRWELTSPLLYQRSAAAVVTHDGAIYVLGGMGQDSVLDKVEMARQKINGHLGTYTKQ